LKVYNILLKIDVEKYQVQNWVIN